MAILAGGSVNKKQSSGIIDLGAVGTAINGQSALQTQAADVKAAADARAVALTSAATREQQAIGTQSLSSAEATRNRQLEVLDGVNGQLEKARIAIALTDSGNPMDRVKLWALQQTDPAYTREGNLARIGYYQSAADALGGIEMLNQQGYQDQINDSKNKLATALQPDQDILAMLQIGIDQGQRKIDAVKGAAETRLSMLTTANGLQDQALANLDLDQVSAAEQQAMSSGNKTANVGGVEISLAQIQSRKVALTDRNYTLYTRELQMQTAALGSLTLEDTNAKIAEASQSKDQKVTLDNGTVVTLAALNERRAGLISQDTGVQQNLANQSIMANTMLNMTNQKILDTMNPTELNRLILNGGVDESNPGVKFDLGLVRQTLQTKSEALQTGIQNQIAVQSVGDPMQAAAQFDSYLNNVIANAQPGSPLYNDVKAKKNMFAYAAGLLGDKDPMTVGAGATVMSNIQKDVEAAIDNEAKRMSNGDAEKEIALKSQLRGQPIPQEVIATALTKKVTKGMPVTGWLSPSNAVIFTTTYQQVYNQLKTNPDTVLIDDTTRKQMAVEQAMTNVMQSASNGMSEQIMAGQVGIDGNPLKGLITPTALLTMMHDSDSKGAAAYQKAAGLDDKAMQDRLSGRIIDPQLNAMQASQLYVSLEKMQPGLGKSYTDWWNSSARDEYVTRYSTAATQRAGKAGFNTLVETSLVAPLLGDQMSQYGAIMNQGRDNVFSTELTRQHQEYVTFKGDPVAKQAFLLEQTQGLTPTDKQQAMTLIFTPMFNEIRNQKMNTEQASVYIESQLRQMKPEDPAVRNLLKKITTNRDGAMKVVDDFQKSQSNSLWNTLLWAASGPFGKPDVGWQTSDQASEGFPWFQDWRKSQQAQ